VCVTALLVREDVEDAVLRAAEADGEPRRRVGLLRDERAALGEEALDVVVLAWLDVETDKQAFGDGCNLVVVMRCASTQPVVLSSPE
jgi:hypothetical protein